MGIMDMGAMDMVMVILKNQATSQKMLHHQVCYRNGLAGWI